VANEKMMCEKNSYSVVVFISNIKRDVKYKNSLGMSLTTGKSLIRSKLVQQKYIQQLQFVFQKVYFFNFMKNLVILKM
jgi:hypothetical protein